MSATQPTYAWFQAVLALSVTTNLTFALIFSLFETSVLRYRSVAQSLLRGAQSFLIYNTDRQVEGSEYLREAKELYGAVDSTSKHLEWITYDLFRPIALGCAVVAFVMLVRSTLLGDKVIDWQEQTLCWITMVPFAIFTFYSVGRATLMSIKVRKVARAVDEKLLDLALDSPNS